MSKTEKDYWKEYFSSLAGYSNCDMQDPYVKEIVELSSSASIMPFVFILLIGGILSEIFKKRLIFNVLPTYFSVILEISFISIGLYIFAIILSRRFRFILIDIITVISSIIYYSILLLMYFTLIILIINKLNLLIDNGIICKILIICGSSIGSYKLSKYTTILINNIFSKGR